MKFLKIIAPVLLTTLISCRENKNTSTNNLQPATKEPVTSVPENAPASSEIPSDDSIVGATENGNKEAKDSLMPVIISFYSIGQGIDRGQTEKLIAFIQSYEKKAGKKIEYSEIHWGREGETDYCFPMKGFSDSQTADFIK